MHCFSDCFYVACSFHWDICYTVKRYGAPPRHDGFSFIKLWNPVTQALKVQKAYSDDKYQLFSLQPWYQTSVLHFLMTNCMFLTSSWCLSPCYCSSISGAPIRASQTPPSTATAHVTAQPSTTAASSFQHHKVGNMKKCTLVTLAHNAMQP
jgi:hypothetical protein